MRLVNNQFLVVWNTPQVTKLLDPKRSQAIGIVIGRIDVREFRDALLNFDAAAFPLDTLKSVYDVV